MKMWTGKQDFISNRDFNFLNNSLPVDRRLAKEDIQGSLAWAGALLHAGFLTKEEYSAISEGLKAILVEIQSNSFEFLESDEDIHGACFG